MTAWFELDVTTDKNDMLVRLLHVVSIAMSFLNGCFVFYMILTVDNWVGTRNEVVGDRYLFFLFILP